ncbi:MULTISPECIES: HD domain-containing protein [Arsenicicoccus]|uniref:Metal-dependent phosphohydrolase n=1 Tax=Arsenicicoccus bolidensis TaxID=229480 RepID=A0ABS9Q281_9MICO|nr:MULTISPECIES: hypothetical protein [Arsenicicoccus]MCG7321380.1 hypothetical protein [Arsenicicoccus bolidensis]
MDELVAACQADLQALAPRADAVPLERAATRLVDHWREPHRTYHGIHHLAEMLAVLGRLAADDALTPPQLLACRVAAWLHDAVYDVTAEPGANEEASAALAVELLDELDAEVDLIEQVAGLVHATAEHGPTTDPVHAAFLDADLWILGAPADRFDEYCRQVRDEYPAVPDDDYRTGRSRILEALVERPHIYATPGARTAWEAAARDNVRRELARLA